MCGLIFTITTVAAPGSGWSITPTAAFTTGVHAPSYDVAACGDVPRT